MTFRDLRREGSGDVAYDVCVVGSGPAGLAVARSLSDHGHRVGILESGGYQIEPAVQELNDGRQSGFADPLRSARPRAFGGASAVWAGHCAMLDGDDLAQDDSIGSPGWPIDHGELKRWYAPALEFLGIDPPLLERPDAGHLDFEGGRLESKPFVQHETRLGSSHRALLADDDGIDVWLHATAVAAQSDGRRLGRLVARDLDGNELRVGARVFVCAAGAIENARLLLWWSNRCDIAIEPAAAAHAGRCFAIHPHLIYGALLLTGEAAAHPLYRRRRLADNHFATTAFQVSAAARREHGLIKVVFRHFDERTQEQSKWYDSRRLGLWRHQERVMFDQMFIQAAMPLRPANGIGLDGERDRLGMPRVRATLSLAAEDFRNYQRSLELYAIELGRHGYGRVKFGTGAFDAHIAGERMLWGGHHFTCTTRMAIGPDSGVVDGDLRVFGCDNLYLAGSSVFGSSGAVNPTLTIVALALRLGEHLHRRL